MSIGGGFCEQKGTFLWILTHSPGTRLRKALTDKGLEGEDRLPGSVGEGRKCKICWNKMLIFKIINKTIAKTAFLRYNEVGIRKGGFPLRLRLIPYS